MRGVTEIDLPSIDCEGKDLDVLRSLDWDRWRPSVVIVEDSTRFSRSVADYAEDVYHGQPSKPVSALTALLSSDATGNERMNGV